MKIQKLPAIFRWIVLVLLFAACNPVKDFTFVQMCDTQLGMSDYHTDSAAFQQAVRQINELKPDLVLICGDLVNHPDDHSYSDFKAIRSGFDMPCYCIAGNHDIMNEPTDSSLTYYRNQIGEDYYQVEHKGVVFVIVNTQLWKSQLKKASEKHDQWVSQTIQACAKKGEPLIVAGHYPLYTENPDEEEHHFNLPIRKRKELLNLFEANNVQAYLSGHTHQLVINTYHNIQLVSGETTSVNINKRPKGFRLWHVSKDTLTNEFVPLLPVK